MSLLDLFPGKWTIYAGIIAGTFAAAGTAAWKFQSMRYEAKENERAQQQLVLEREAHTLELKRQSAVVSAQNAAAARAIGLRSDADTARASANSLRDSAERAMRASQTSLDACLVTATTVNKLFLESVTRYGEVAESADRHASDVQTLTESWPK